MELSIPSTASLETFINVIKKGISIGKLKIAIILKLPLVLAAIADIIVKIDEKPILPKNRDNKNIGKFCTM
jgi:hypothetical protein